MAKITTALRKSFEKAQESHFDFYKEVSAAYAAFPQMTRTIFFVDVNKNNIIHPDAAIRAEITATINAHPDFREELAEDCLKLRNDRLSACKPIVNGGGAIFFVMLYLEKDLQSSLDGTRHVRENQHLTLDHEFAHALIKHARGSTIKCESIADSYAALRHFQRYGTDTGLVETLMRRRAALAFANNDSVHFTSPALENVLSVKDDFDFKTMTPVQIASMADYIGSSSAPRGNEKQLLDYHFKKSEAPFIDFKDDTPLKKLATRVFASRAPVVNKWGKVALSAFLDKKIKLLVDDRPLGLNSTYWNKVRTAIRAQDNKLPRP